jgi:hypothetical protein
VLATRPHLATWESGGGGGLGRFEEELEVSAHSTIEKTRSFEILYSLKMYLFSIQI